MFGYESKADKQLKILNQMNELVANTTRSGPYGEWGQQQSSNQLHDINVDFGYPNELTFTNFFEMYDRFGIAKAVVDIKPELSWLSPPKIEASESVERELDILIKNTNLWNRMKGLDTRQRVGSYAGMYIEVADSKAPNEELGQLAGVGQVINLKPMYEGQLKVETTQNDPKEPGYGNPTMYSFESTGEGDRDSKDGTSFLIHPSRIIIAAEGADDGSIYGISALKAVFNDLQDLRKICGAGGEGFYQNSRNAPVINTKEGFKAPTGDEKEKLDMAIDDFLGKFQKKLLANGIELEYNNITLDKPKEHYDDSLNNVSAGSGIPSAILIGQQMGVRASDKDFQLLMITIQSRRENFLNELVTQVIDWFMDHGALQRSPFEVIWEDLTAPSDDERLGLAIKMSEANEKAFKAGISPIFSEDEIREVAGYEKLDAPIPTETIEEEDVDDITEELG